MANGTTLTIVTRQDKTYKQSVTASDAGDPGAGTVQVLYDDNEPQMKILQALDDARAYIVENHKKR
jgi:hypothetical protein